MNYELTNQNLQSPCIKCSGSDWNKTWEQ